MGRVLVPLSMLSLVSIGGIFGFFYAWVCSTMWGLDATDPRVAITAMNAMNASVRNIVFFPAFFLTPVLLAVTGFIAFRGKRRVSATLFGLAAVIYLCGGLIATMSINVPMNEALALVEVPTEIEAAREIWQTYSERWQFWNTFRTIVSGVSLILTGFALLHLKEAVR